MDAAPLAMRAFHVDPKLAIDELLRFISSAPLANRINQLARLRRCQVLDKLCQTPFEFAVFHEWPPLRRTNQEHRSRSISIHNANRAIEIDHRS
jgi:hypothetical protein